MGVSEIAVFDGATEIVDGTLTTVDFGTAYVGIPVTKTFMIDNTAGLVDLVLSNLTVGGLPLPTGGFSNPGGFPATVAAGATGTFSIQLDATAQGTYSGTLQFDNNDCTEDPFNFPITGVVENIDFGDALDPGYPTLLVNDGPRHTIGSGLYLGSDIDAEADGQPNATATGDDSAGTDDEDGVSFTSSIIAGQTAGLTVTASIAGSLDAWIDFNADGDWADAGEQVFTSAALTAGANNLNIAVPSGATAGQTFARFRFSSAGGLSYTGLAADGEVEDYQITILADTDGDGTPDITDGCPADPLKIAAGACGCGVADTDADSDGTADCNDGCPADPLKTAAGVCGCGVADTDSDSDGTANCNDGCPADPLKTAAGICGCGVADTDTDSDGTADCNDGCPADPLKIAAGACGCGVADTDSDSDGTPNCNDGCPADVKKVAPGTCGCGVADTDTDSDGTPDCNDGCPADINKTTPGTCGCGVADTDTDRDGTADCNDKDSPMIPPLMRKLTIKKTGTGSGTVASTPDGINCGSDCNEFYYPQESVTLTANAESCSAFAGWSGGGCSGTGPCTVALDADVTVTARFDVKDADGDGTPDCDDGCPNDAAKTAPGACGCGVADADTDQDGALDCNDGCPNDPAKTAPGACGCGKADVDTDQDGTLDCNDRCPSDPAKTTPGVCGCGVSDVDTDSDGTPDCNDDTPDGEDDETCTDMPQPVLPADGAAGVSTGPTLEIAFDVDPDTCGEHNRTRWQISESPDFEGAAYSKNTTGDGPVSLQVAPGTLKPETTYYWRARVWCGSGCRSEYSDVFSFTTGPVPNDVNANGVPDEQEPEGETDVNGDGQPDVQGSNFRVLKPVVGNGLIAIETTGNITFLQSLDPHAMAIQEGMPAYMPWGLINFRIEIDNPADTVQLTIYFSEEAPAGSIFYKYDPATGWLDYTEHATFAPDMKSVVIEIQDGGFGDLDGVANGVIVDPCGIGLDAEPSPDDGGGDGGTCFLRTVIKAHSR